jgi:hypothetical protein
VLGVTQDRDPHGADLVFPPCVLSSVSLDTLEADPQTTLDCQAVSGWYVCEPAVRVKDVLTWL